MGIRAKARSGSAIRSALCAESLAEEPQTFPACGRQSSLGSRCRLHELLIEPGHASAAVGTLLADLEEPLARHFAAGAFEVVQDAEHHPRLAIIAAVIKPEVEARAPCLIGRSTQKPLDPLEPSLHIEQLHLLHQGPPLWRAASSDVVAAPPRMMARIAAVFSSRSTAVRASRLRRRSGSVSMMAGRLGAAHDRMRVYSAGSE